jgi:hypothetical protein
VRVRRNHALAKTVGDPGHGYILAFSFLHALLLLPCPDVCNRANENLTNAVHYIPEEMMRSWIRFFQKPDINKLLPREVEAFDEIQD